MSSKISLIKSSKLLEINLFIQQIKIEDLNSASSLNNVNSFCVCAKKFQVFTFLITSNKYRNIQKIPSRKRPVLRCFESDLNDFRNLFNVNTIISLDFFYDCFEIKSFGTQENSLCNTFHGEKIEECTREQFVQYFSQCKTKERCTKEQSFQEKLLEIRILEP